MFPTLVSVCCGIQVVDHCFVVLFYKVYTDTLCFTTMSSIIIRWMLVAVKHLHFSWFSFLFAWRWIWFWWQCWRANYNILFYQRWQRVVRLPTRGLFVSWRHLKLLHKEKTITPLTVTVTLDSLWRALKPVLVYIIPIARHHVKLMLHFSVLLFCSCVTAVVQHNLWWWLMVKQMFSKTFSLCRTVTLCC